MKYNNNIIPVFTRFNQDDIYTEGDIVFGIKTDLTSENPLVLMKCIKETIKGSTPDSDHFEPLTTNAYASAAKTYEQLINGESTMLVTKTALVETLERLVGKNLNSNGTNQYLPSGSDFNTMENTGRWLLNMNATYSNLPTSISMKDWEVGIYESYNLGSINIQILFFYDKYLPQWIIFRRSKSSNSSWRLIDWYTDQEVVVYNSFINNYNALAAKYLESLRLLNAKADSIRYTSVGIVGSPNDPGYYELPCRFKALSLPDGYFEVQILNRLDDMTEQIVASFTAEDIEYVKYIKSSIKLSTNNDIIRVSLNYAESSSSDKYVDGSTIESGDVILTIDGSGSPYIKILKLPLKVAENG